MKIDWTVTQKDVAKIQAFVAAQSANPLVMDRKRRNLAKPKPKVSRQQFWRRLVGARADVIALRFAHRHPVLDRQRVSG